MRVPLTSISTVPGDFHGVGPVHASIRSRSDLSTQAITPQPPRKPIPSATRTAMAPCLECRHRSVVFLGVARSEPRGCWRARPYGGGHAFQPVSHMFQLVRPASVGESINRVHEPADVLAREHFNRVHQRADVATEGGRKHLHRLCEFSHGVPI
ncbi:MAG: hypothetical protein ACRDT4_03370 [Micromonosporaceae bacterium]